MPLLNFVRELFPQYYWSAGFIAVLFVVAALACLLYVLTRWTPWMMVCLAAALYLLPFFFNLR